MFYIYILQSKKDYKLYVGYTNDLRKRFTEHNKGLVLSTRYRKPFILVIMKHNNSKKDAKSREEALKRFSGSMIHLRKRIKNSVIFSK